MDFRPALWMTIFSLLAFSMLIALGSWQVARLQVKNEIIDKFTSRAHSKAITPPSVDTAEMYEYQRLMVRGTWLHDAEIHLTGRTFEGTAGYHLITPMQLEDGRILLMNRGWVGEDYRFSSSRPSTLTTGLVEIDAILRLPPRKGYFVPENDFSGNHWFTLNPDEITKHHQLGDNVILTYTADVLREEGAYVMPIGAAVNINIANNHLQYALTWYGLALCLLGVYFSWHVQQGRLKFKRG